MWRLDPMHNEPKPRKYAKIHCFDCKRDVGSKAQAAQSHRGHDVDYLDASGERMS